MYDLLQRAACQKKNVPCCMYTLINCLRNITPALYANMIYIQWFS